VFSESREDRESEDLERIEWLEEFAWREAKRKYDFRSWQMDYLRQDPRALEREAERQRARADRKHEEARQQFLRVPTTRHSLPFAVAVVAVAAASIP
jgi:hypothetical protein